MKNLDARIALLSQNGPIRARSKRDPTSGETRSGAPADAFEAVFRRMKSQASLAEPAAGNSSLQSQSLAAQKPAQGVRAKAVSHFRNGRDSGQTGPPAVGRKAVSPALAAVIDATQEGVQPADGAVTPDIDGALIAGLQPGEPSAAMVATLAEEAALDSVVAEAEQFTSEAVRSVSAEQLASEAMQEFSVEQLTPEELPLPSAEQFLAKSIGQIAVETQGNRSVETALEGKAGFVPPLPDGAIADANVFSIMSEPKNTVPTGDLSAYFQQNAAGKLNAGAVQSNAAPNIPVLVSDAIPGGDTLIRGQPQEMAGPAAGPALDPSNGTAPAQALPVATAANVMGVVRDQLVEQIVRGVHMAQHNETTEIIVQLRPEFLGKVSIRVLADHHAMHVEIRAENEAVRQVMQHNLADLQQRLSEKGFGFDQFNVLADTGMNSQHRPEWHFGLPSASRSNASVTAIAEPPMEKRLVAATGAIDYFA